MTSGRPHIFSCFLSILTLVLVSAGGLVTSTGSGLAVPDWPLSYGSLFPPMIGGIRFEHSHRVIAFFVALFTLVLTAVVIRDEKRIWMKWLALAALLLVIAQALLGGLTVLMLLPRPVSVAHACAGQTFFVTVVLMALFTSRWWKEDSLLTAPAENRVKSLSVIVSALLYLQLILGAYVRHSGGGVMLHLANAFLAFFCVIVLANAVSKGKGEAGVVRDTSRLALLIIVQLFLGFAVFATVTASGAENAKNTVAAVILRTAHQTVGAIVLAAAAVVTARLFRVSRTKPMASTPFRPTATSGLSGMGRRIPPP